ncbi:MAG: LemA family protein, partial [Bacilli bacterium]
MIILIIIGIIILLLAIFIGVTYNSLVSVKNRVKDQWANIDVLLKRRADLIPNLVETVKGYAKHEKTTFNEIIEARNKSVIAKTPEDSIEASSMLSEAMGKLFALSEAYPDLKANTNFMQLQTDLSDTEDKISFARQFYNDAVLIYKNKLEMFPSNIIASMFGFKPEAFFEAVEVEKKTPEVK